MKKFIQIDEKTGAKSEVCSFGEPNHPLQFEVAYNAETSRLKYNKQLVNIEIIDAPETYPDAPPGRGKLNLGLDGV